MAIRSAASGGNDVAQAVKHARNNAGSKRFITTHNQSAPGMSKWNSENSRRKIRWISPHFTISS